MRFLSRQRRRAHKASGYPVILFTVGDYLFAISASAVNEIQALQGMEALNPELSVTRMGKVKHMLHREGRRYWVVDSNIHFHIPPSANARVLLMNESPVALKVDTIVRMGEISKVVPLPQAFQCDERNWYLGLSIIDDKVVPVVNPNSFLSQFDFTALDAAVAIPQQETGLMA